ncbi:hypothetical protein ACFL20_00460 [Spirochaetota bacterium]
MKMKSFKLIFTAFSVFILVLVTSCKTKSMIAVESEYEFEPVVAGMMVKHDFKIKNIGNEPLNILRVRPG